LRIGSGADNTIRVATTKKLTAALLSGRPDRVAAKMSEAARFLSAVPAGACLGALLEDRERAARILDLVADLDHVGFMALPEDPEALRETAGAAGFARAVRVFPSTILTHELARLAGRTTVPTTIFKARGVESGQGTRAVEVAMPDGVKRQVIEGWIRDGIGAHVAFAVHAAADLHAVGEHMRGAGYRPVKPAPGGEFTNPAELVTTRFFERRPEHPLGVEFCHYGAG
jgi:hypothetical protein